MTHFKHNKKRNAGLISEFFSRYIASAFIEGRHEDIEKANRIWKKYINPKTETYKELVLFNALHETSFKNKEIAYSLLEKAKEAAKKQSQQKLDKEKSALINEINLGLKDEQFFYRSVDKYKSIASVQLLMNAWRGIGFKGTITDLATLEESVLEHMMRPKTTVSEEVSEFTTGDVDSLVVKMMNEKFNKKYSDVLSDEQKKIVNLFVFAGRQEDKKTELVRILENIRFDTLKVLKNGMIKEGFDRPLKNKLTEIQKMLDVGGEYSNPENLSDNAITFYMTVSKLREELVSKDEVTQRI